MKKVLIIAEAGVNHNGSVAVAKKMIRAAKDAGADIVKFQTFKAELLASKHAQKASYQKKSSGSGESQLQMLRQLELNEEAHEILIRECAAVGIRFLSTAFDLTSLALLKKLRLPLYKIPSGEITNYPYLAMIAGWKKEIVLSTGMSTLGDIEAALNVLTENGTPRSRITVLHCNTEYPTPMQDVNLRAMVTIGKTFGVRYGYSDHTAGIEIPIAAVALGATVIEKHFTLDRSMKGPDHQASLEPHELKAMVDAIRNVEQGLGDELKRPTASERKNIGIARKSIVAAMPIQKGEMFTEKNLTVKRPGTGISPMLWNSVIGKRAAKAFAPDDVIEL